MALVQYGSVSEAVEALVQLHNYQAAPGINVKVSFSKNNPASSAPSEAPDASPPSPSALPPPPVFL
jgi:hypothetical protein